jgi:transcriptional regulator with XRE-family HTH domain
VATKRSQADIFLNIEEARAFAEHLRKLRKAKGLTQEDLAFEANVDRVTIARIETTQQNFTFDILISLAKALKIEPKELLDF